RILGIEWEQQRRLDYHAISLQDLGAIMSALGAGDDAMVQVMETILDPTQEDGLTLMVQQLSPILSRPDARKIVQSLRETGMAAVPVAYPFINKPRWTALRPCVDVLFPSETSDLQEGRWFCRMDTWVSA